MNKLGQKVNGYEFVDTLGDGSFSDVYKVKKGDIFYAAKILKETYFQEEYQDNQKRVLREIEILKMVNSKFLIRYEDDFFFENEFGIKEYAIITEYFQGISLDKLLKKKPNESKLIDIFIKILEGVRALHNTKVIDEGIIHRDLKPANILVDDNCNVKIIDYGLSKVIDFSSITSTGATIGTPLYMAPEQLVDSKNVDYRIDIYALGVILFEMMTGKMPYRASTLPELYHKIMNEPIIPPKTIRPDIDDRIEKAIYKATAKEAYSRYQNINDFLSDITTKIQKNDYVTKGKYYAWVYKEKDVAFTFMETQATDIIYPIHVRNWSKQLHDHFRSNGFKNVIIDPSTQRLSYVTFAKTSGLKELPYAPAKGVISLEFLQDKVNREQYIVKWYNTVQEGNKLILPYHYISNTNYDVGKIENWIKTNIQLANESLDVISSEKMSYAMISIGLNHLVYESKKILSYYVRVNTDGFIVQVSDLRQLNEQSLKSYIDFVIQLQKYTGKPVILLKVPIALGLVLLSHGIHGFSLGLAGIDYFDEQYIKEDKDPFNLYAKFYFPQLLSFNSFPRKDQYVFDEIFRYMGGCNCKWCQGKSAIEISSGDKGLQLHFWECIEEEVEKINRLDISEKKPYIIRRIRMALDTINSAPSDMSKILLNSDYKKLLSCLESILRG